MTSNPYAREPVEVTVAGLRVYAPGASAARWIEATCSRAGILGVLTGLTDDATAERLVERVADGHATPEDVAKAAYDMLGQATEYRWWKTARLLSLSTRADIAGALTLKGLDPSRLAVGQWCAAVYVLVTQGTAASERFKTDVAFDDPPPGAEADDDWMSEAEFNAMVESARNAPGQS